ncbi:HNH endonuclease domain-containing protein [Maridesulfovibrio salexigens]|uniref:HNH nuclease domain-containing protein n=1 Tax=Maridesulfovibrio salexigens (strain ATCC 14822 / DSM 2638 / NCIMB 8403 / VKM B-1763) TaxID=526222 RepID=C6BT14_MARSD|nr:HNH endonuclease domain-containing protein [Maridesulfovibrio salexigens]ACS79718.1 hypothetical protein Desal_1656 [Maridesulfovibrio salexigens DSM 2638]
MNEYSRRLFLKSGMSLLCGVSALPTISYAEERFMSIPKAQFQNGITTAAHYASTLKEGSFIEFSDTDAQSRIMLRAYGFYLVNQTENGAVFHFSPSRNQGIETIGGILYDDSKVATYKIALLKALVDITSGLENERIHYDTENAQDYAYIPYGLIAFKWVVYYWPLVEASIRQISSPKMSFEDELLELQDIYTKINKVNPLAQFQQDFIAGYKPDSPIYDVVRRLMRSVVTTIKDGPVEHSGAKNTFETSDRFNSGRLTQTKRSLSDFAGCMKCVRFKTGLLFEMQMFGSMMSDAIAVQWGNECVRLQKKQNRNLAEILPYLFVDAFEERNQNEARNLIKEILQHGEKVFCIYSGKPLPKKYDMDHLLPYAIFFNNDLWNLVPSLPTVNNKKSNKIITLDTLDESKSRLFAFWNQTRSVAEEQFCSELEATLQIDPLKSNWEQKTFSVVSKQAELTAQFRGLPRWTYTP